MKCVRVILVLQLRGFSEVFTMNILTHYLAIFVVFDNRLFFHDSASVICWLTLVSSMTWMEQHNKGCDIQKCCGVASSCPRTHSCRLALSFSYAFIDLLEVCTCTLITIHILCLCTFLSYITTRFLLELSSRCYG